MSALIFIVETLLSLALFVVLARLLLQLTRADFRNPICQAVVRLTNPLILPLRPKTDLIEPPGYPPPTRECNAHCVPQRQSTRPTAGGQRAAVSR